MRLIDADALIKDICSDCRSDIQNACKTDPLCGIVMCIKEVQTVDAEKVVYCKDCVYCRPLDGNERHRFDEYPIYCLHNGLGVVEHDFCSYGDRGGD